VAVASIVTMAIANANAASKPTRECNKCTLHRADATCSGVFVSTRNLMKALDESQEFVDDGTSSTCSSMNTNMSVISSTSSCWEYSGSLRHNQGAPLLVVDPDSKKNVEDKARALGDILVKSRSLPGMSMYASNHIMVNQERVSRLTAPLSRLQELDECAREQAEEMAAQQRLFHCDPAEVQDFLENRTCRRLGENVARGCCLHDIHKAMMQNISDRNNILDRRFCNFGMASVRGEDGLLYVCQLFRG
jgi:hypothetical protein